MHVRAIGLAVGYVTRRVAAACGAKTGGQVGTDRWSGPRSANIRLTRINAPIEFDPEFPFLQVQPVHRGIYNEALDARG